MLRVLVEHGVDFVVVGAMKEATGRPRDALVASELRVLADEIRDVER